MELEDLVLPAQAKGGRVDVDGLDEESLRVDVICIASGIRARPLLELVAHEATIPQKVLPVPCEDNRAAEQVVPHRLHLERVGIVKGEVLIKYGGALLSELCCLCACRFIETRLLWKRSCCISLPPST